MGAVRGVPSTKKYMGPPTTTTITMMGTPEKRLDIYSIHTRQINLKGMYICADPDQSTVRLVGRPVSI